MLNASFYKGPILRWLRQIGTMNDFLGFILFLMGYIRSCLGNLWESFAARGRTSEFFTTESIELPELVDQDAIETQPLKTSRKRKLPVPPAFRSEKDYPVDWLVYSKTLGVVPKTQADKLLQEMETGLVFELEKAVNTRERELIESAPTLISRTNSEPSPSTTSSSTSSVKDRSQSDDKSSRTSQAVATNNTGFTPVMQSVVAT